MSDVIVIPSLILAAFKTALIGNTDAGDRVYLPRDWPTGASLLPAILLSNPKEHKESKGPNAPEYDVYGTFRVKARSATKATPGNAAAGAMLTELQTLQRQIETTVVNNYALYLMIEQISGIETETSTLSDGALEVGELTMDFVVKFYQGPEAFAPIDFEDIQVFNAFGDLESIFDPNGTYMPPFPYPVPAAPRIVGPDGRVEIAVSETMP